MRVKTCLTAAILMLCLFHQAAFAQFKDVVWIKGGNAAGAHSVLFSPDGKYIIANGKVTRFLDIATGNLSRVVNLGVSIIQFSTDGKYLAGGPGDYTIRILDASTWDLVATFPLPGNAYQLVLSPDLKFAITNTGYPDSTIALWEIASGNLLRTVNARTNSVSLAAFSPDARYFLSRNGDNTLKLWETATGNLARTFAGFNAFYPAFSPDGKYLAFVSSGRIKLLEVATGNLIRTFVDAPSALGTPSFSQDGKYLFTVNGYNNVSRSGGTIGLWEVATGNLLRIFGGQNYGERAFSASLSPDGKYIVSVNDDQTVKLWDAATGAPAKTLTAHTSAVSAVAFSVDGRYVASSAGYGDPIKLWDVATGNFVRAFSVEPNWYSTFSFSPKGRFIAAPAFDGIRLWDVASAGYLNLLKPQTGTVSGKLLFSSDEQYLAGVVSGAIKLWAIHGGQVVQTFAGHLGSTLDLSFSVDETRLVSIGADKKIKLWEIASGTLVKSVEAQIGEVNIAAFSPDARHVALGGSFGLKLYETATGNFVRDFAGQPGSQYPLRISFSSDGRYIVCTVRDQKIRIWEAATGRNVYTYDNEFLPNLVSYPSNLIPISLSPDSKYIAGRRSGDARGSKALCRKTPSRVECQWHRQWSLFLSPANRRFCRNGKTYLVEIVSKFRLPPNPNSCRSNF